LGATWVVDSLDGVADSFDGVAVSRSGRVWSPLTGELRQSPSVGEERVLAERNRRERLLHEHEEAAQRENAAAAAVERLARAYNAALAEHQGTAPDRRSWLERVRAAIARDEALLPAVHELIDALESATAAISQQGARFEGALAEDREAGEHLAVELRACAQQEAVLQAQLHGENEAVTEAQVQLQRVRDRVGETERDLEHLAGRLGLAAEPAEEELDAERGEELERRQERLARRREQLGPVNPLAQQEYAEAVEHVEELERQRADLETAMRELEKLIADANRQIRESFEQTFEAAARNFEQVAAQLFPGGAGRLRLVRDRDAPAPVLGGEEPPADEPDATDADEPELQQSEAEEERLGVEIEITPGGKEMKRLSLLSGGEKAMTALAFLFAVFLARPCPFYILDEVEAALDDLNIDRFLEMLRSYSERAQFIVVTHQKRTMEAADVLYGVSMGGDGISKVISRRLPQEQAAA
jgi:chromosome segregation protein